MSPSMPPGSSSVARYWRSSMAWMSGVATSGAMAGAGSDDVSPSARAAMACSTVSIVVSGEPTNPASASRSEEHTSELQSLMRNSYAVFCLKKKKQEQSYTQKQNTFNENTDRIHKK